jgi:AAA+ superfamily predicted ATPase
MRARNIHVTVQPSSGDVLKFTLAASSSIRQVREEVAKRTSSKLDEVTLIWKGDPVLEEAIKLEALVADEGNASSLFFQAFTEVRVETPRTRLTSTLSSKSTSSLDVRDFGLAFEHVEALLAGVKKNPQLSDLFLDGNSLGDKGLAFLAEHLLRGSKTIHRLSICNNKIGDEGCIALATALKYGSSVSKLVLDHNNIGERGAKALAEAISSEQSALTYLVVDRDTLFSCEELQLLLSREHVVVRNNEFLGAKLLQAVSNEDFNFLRNNSEKNLGAIKMGLFGNYRHGLIHQAALEGKVKSAEVLLKEFQVDVDLRSGFGRTALHEASQSGRVVMVEFLIRAGADLDALDDYGCTPLSLACSEGNMEVAKLLVSGGAAVDIRSRNGVTALDLLGYQSREANLLRKLSSDTRSFQADLKREKDKWWRNRKFNLDSAPTAIRDVAKIDVLAAYPLPEDEPHRQMYMALAFLAHPKLFELEDVERELSDYERDRKSASPLLLLAHARLKSIARDENSFACRCMLLKEFAAHAPWAKDMMTEEEKTIAFVKTQQQHQQPRGSERTEPTPLEKLQAEWEQLSRSLTEKQREPMDALMKMVGLFSVKKIALNLYKSMLRDRELMRQGKKDAIVPKVLNFAFVGNPGSGKTVTAELFASLLEQSGARSGHKFVQMTASQALQKGAAAFSAQLETLTGGKKGVGPPPTPLRRNMAVEVECEGGQRLCQGVINSIDKSSGTYEIKYADGTIEEDVKQSRIFYPGQKTAIGGVLFLDEAYDLDPANNRDGKLILADLMQAAEEHRDTISIILAGYQDDIEKKLYSFNSGMASRFQTVQFDDFTEAELKGIWTDLGEKYKWTVDRKATNVAVARIARGRNLKGFGNARTVRKMFLRIASDAANPGHISVDDVVGPRPDRKSSPELNAALTELEELIGQAKVKEAVMKIVKQAEVNYDRELKGLKVSDIGLNRLFLGNPGTGKTTVAAIYGKVLKALRLLSNGELMSKTASDFVGDVVGASQSRTRALIESAQGKVLLIDEAYVLDDGMYGKQALDTIVEKVQGAPGEDIAVVMIGYKPQILKMLREQNPGLSRRFQPANAFEFEDFTDSELLETFVSYCRKDSVYAPPDVKALAVKLLRQQRTLPNFGNAGAVKTLLAQSKQNAANRQGNDAASERLTLLPKDLQPKTVGLSEQEEALKILEGFGSIGNKMRAIGEMIQVRNREGRSLDDLLSNFVFYGAPGTGKTTVARQIAKLLHMFGVLATDQVTETSGASLTGSFVGKAKEIVKDKMEAARGGVLFIDEAYQMGEGSYGREAVAQLVEMLTTEHFMGGKSVVILAGYKDDIDAMMTTNEGLKSRFETWVPFENWSSDRSAIFVLEQIRKAEFEVNKQDEAKKILSEAFEILTNRPGWGNGRDALTMFKKIIRCRDIRVARGGDKGGISDEDFKVGAREFLESRAEAVVAPGVKWISDTKKEKMEYQSSMARPAIQGVAKAEAKREANAGNNKEEKDDDAGVPLQKDEDADGADKKADGYWFGVPVEALKPLSDALHELGWDSEAKILELSTADPSTNEDLKQLVKKLIAKGIDEGAAKKLIRQWAVASEQMRKQKYQEQIDKLMASRKPIVQCQVCKRTANYWAPCYVAPMIIGWKRLRFRSLRGEGRIEVLDAE